MIPRHLKIIPLLSAFCILAPLWGPAHGFRMAPVERTVLSNGLILLVSEEHSLPSVTFQLLLEAGARSDPPGQEGVAHLTARGLLLGTSTLTAPQINKSLDFLGASLETSTGKDFMTMGLRVLKKDLDKGFGLFLETLTRPSFPEDEMKRQIQRTLGAIQSEEDERSGGRGQSLREDSFRGESLWSPGQRYLGVAFTDNGGHHPPIPQGSLSPEQGDPGCHRGYHARGDQDTDRAKA